VGLYRGSMALFAAKYRELAVWFLERQAALDYGDAEIDDLAVAIDCAIDGWFSAERAKIEAASEGRIPGCHCCGEPTCWQRCNNLRDEGEKPQFKGWYCTKHLIFTPDSEPRGEGK